MDGSSAGAILSTGATPATTVGSLARRAGTDGVVAVLVGTSPEEWLRGWPGADGVGPRVVNVSERDGASLRLPAQGERVSADLDLPTSPA
jgi:hypothetical protein